MLFYFDMRESHSEIKKCENKKIPTQLSETVRFLEISMDRTFIFDFSPHESRIMSSTLNFTWGLHLQKLKFEKYIGIIRFQI